MRTRTYRYYRCANHISKGKCSNHRSLGVDEIHDIVSIHLKQEVLTPERLARVVADLAAEQAARPNERAETRRALTEALRSVEQRLQRLAAVVEAGGDLRVLGERTKLAEAERGSIVTKIEHEDGLARAATLDGQARIDAELLLAGWAHALEAGVLIARQALRKLLAGPIVVRPEADKSWTYRAVIAANRWFGGTIGPTEVDAVDVTDVTGGRRRQTPDLSPEAMDLGRLATGQASRLSVSPSSRSWR